ncbi:MAG: hypothetical protein K2K37_03300 [Muribaculaceae bacterium]|nr:hypothetical protein [Muribaculaceae bacterium]
MKKIPRSTLIPSVLLVYLAVMSYFGYLEYAAGKSSPLYFYGIIASTLVVIFLLHLTLRRKERLRNQRNDSDKL